MSFSRIPEDSLMLDHTSVTAFHDAGEPGGPLAPIYHFNAIHLSRLIPEGGTFVDMGCGSGQFLKYFLSGRPDVQGIGLDLSAPMLQLTARNLAELHAGRPVRVIQAAFAEVDQALPDGIDAVACLSALHHCPALVDLCDVMTSLSRLQQRQQNAIWLFDVVRPESLSLTELIPRTFEVSSRSALPLAFRQDWTASLQAGWTVSEFQEALSQASLSMNSLLIHSGAGLNYWFIRIHHFISDALNGSVLLSALSDIYRQLLSHPRPAQRPAFSDFVQQELSLRGAAEFDGHRQWWTEHRRELQPTLFYQSESRAERFRQKRVSLLS